jgi:predicted PurR-regulated permease PerM
VRGEIYRNDRGLPPDHIRHCRAESFAAIAQQQQQLSLQQYGWIIAVVAIFALLLHLLGEILTPFLIGAILAYIGDPAVSWGERHRVPRTVGTLVVLAITILAVLGLILVLTPLVHSEFAQVMKRLPNPPCCCIQVAPWLQQTFV